mgnify:CR=1 FL=1
MGVIKNLYNYRELLKTNITKDVGGKYKNSFLDHEYGTDFLFDFVFLLLEMIFHFLKIPIFLPFFQK